MLITHGTLVTMGTPNEVLPDGALYIEGEQIADLGPSAELEARHPEAERLDAGGRLVMPGGKHCGTACVPCPAGSRC